MNPSLVGQAQGLREVSVGIRVYVGLGFRHKGLGFRDKGLRFRDKGLRFRDKGLGFRF